MECRQGEICQVQTGICYSSYRVSDSRSVHVRSFSIREVVVVAVVLFINPVNDGRRVASMRGVKGVEFRHDFSTNPNRSINVKENISGIIIIFKQRLKLAVHFQI